MPREPEFLPTSETLSAPGRSGGLTRHGGLRRRTFLGLVGAGLTGVTGMAGADAAEGSASTFNNPPFRYLSRADWGADESRRFGANGVESFPTAFYPLQTVTVHHSALAGGTDHNTADPAALMRNLYRNMTGDDPLHTYGDFGYHFLIDEAGTVYEGRYSGTDPIPAFNAAGQVVTAAHIAGWNSGNLGIVVLGDFNVWSPTEAAETSLTQLLALIAGPHQLDPHGTTNFVNPVNGALKTVPTISGHFNWVVTDCPGASLKAELPAIRDAVATLLI
ncbi:MAG TPA: N-acetylmuramoyl-L-alanine amidase [Kineosporiaceae bacterium]|nr:N-acetylmuramoyl-L-alanine amidase [Kineosporiaceae bacterium]